MNKITPREERYDKRCDKKEKLIQKQNRNERYQERCTKKQETKEMILNVKLDVKNEFTKMVNSPIVTRSRYNNEKLYFFD